MKLVLDAGALIGIDRSDRRTAALIELGRRAGAELITAAPVLAQAWRDGARQAVLAKSLPMIDIRPTSVDDAKRAGTLLAKAGSSDVVDAFVALLVAPHDQVLTSDADDIRTLLNARPITATIVRV